MCLDSMSNHPMSQFYILVLMKDKISFVTLIKKKVAKNCDADKREDSTSNIHFHEEYYKEQLKQLSDDASNFKGNPIKYEENSEKRVTDDVVNIDNLKCSCIRRYRGCNLLTDHSNMTFSKLKNGETLSELQSCETCIKEERDNRVEGNKCTPVLYAEHTCTYVHKDISPIRKLKFKDSISVIVYCCFISLLEKSETFQVAYYGKIQRKIKEAGNEQKTPVLIKTSVVYVAMPINKRW